MKLELIQRSTNTTHKMSKNGCKLHTQGALNSIRAIFIQDVSLMKATQSTTGDRRKNTKEGRKS